jgi:hypothetical protein
MHVTRTEQKHSWRDRLELLVHPITSARMNLVWRLFGFVLVLLWLQHMDEDSVFTFAEKSAASLDALAICGLLLLAAGPSLLVLLGSAVVGAWFFADVLAGVPTLDFMADEYAVQAGLPIVAVIVSGVHVAGVVLRRGARADAQLRAEVDDLHARIFRIFTLTTLAFAGLHKLNADFFATGSCATLANRLYTYWALPFEPPTAGPLGVVTLELLAAIMLLAYPRVGILLVVYVMAGLGHIGPTAFAATCVVMSLAFLDRGDIALVRSWFARRWGVVVASTLVVIGISFSSYEAYPPWLEYGLLEALLVAVTCMVIGVGVARLRHKATLRRRLVPAALRWWKRPATVVPGLSSWLALILIVNGMTPYLGVKYRFSVAMLSNLRVDQERWNSYVVPKWVRLRKSTPHVLVVWHPLGPWAEINPNNDQHYLSDGLFSADALSEALQDAATRRATGHLSLTYLDEGAEFELPADMLEAMSWVKHRPSSTLWQAQLGRGDEPQTCIH